MPRVKTLSSEERLKEEIRLEMRRCADRYGYSPEKMAQTMGVSEATYFNRQKNPLDMRMSEAIRLVRALPGCQIIKMLEARP